MTLSSSPCRTTMYTCVCVCVCACACVLARSPARPLSRSLRARGAARLAAVRGATLLRHSTGTPGAGGSAMQRQDLVRRVGGELNHVHLRGYLVALASPRRRLSLKPVFERVYHALERAAREGQRRDIKGENARQARATDESVSVFHLDTFSAPSAWKRSNRCSVLVCQPHALISARRAAAPAPRSANATTSPESLALGFCREHAREVE